MAAKVEITRFRGDTDPMVFTFSKNKVPLDLTGSSFILSVSADQTPTTPTYLMQVIGAVGDPLLGTVTFTPLAIDVDFVGNYFYDVEMTNGLSVKTVVSGKFKMIQDITK
jgi:hypothetical protein